MDVPTLRPSHRDKHSTSQWSPWWISLAVTIAAILAGGCGQATGSMGVKDTPENREIVAAVQRFYDASLEAYLAEDISLLDQILVDDELYLKEIGTERTEELREYVELVSGLERAEQIGYLTAMQNKLTHRLHGERLLRDEMARADAEGRAWSAEDELALASRNYGQVPGLPSQGVEPWNLTLDKFTSIQIDGDRARAIYDGGIKNQTALLVRIDERWFIAGIL